MKFSKKSTLKEVSVFLNREYIGHEDHIIAGMNEIHNVESGDVIYVDHPKYYDKAIGSLADTIIINKNVQIPEHKALIISDNPFEDYNKLAVHFFPQSTPNEQSLNAKIDPSAEIYPNVFIGKNVTIGANSRICSGASIMDNVSIGENVIIGPNSVIGHFAFYYKQDTKGHKRMHSIGNVRIEDYVEIGALCSIDQGVSDSTVIGLGTKIDNQVQIGHDTKIGQHCIIASGVGISGCVRIEDHVILWGQVGCASNVTIGAKAVVLGQAGVSKNLEGNKTYFGSPCGESLQKFKELTALKKLPEILKTL